MKTIIEMKKVSKVYDLGDVAVNALRGIDIEIKRGEFVAVMGASGSGKSTLMNIIGCLDQPTTGDYYLDGVNINDLSSNELADIRNQKIGFVFQVFNLLPRTSALENVELPLLYDRSGLVKDPRKGATWALNRVGLGDRISHEPHQLSGGQRQRVAIARALVNQPEIILADEPTGNIDTRASIDLLSVFQKLNDQGNTIVLVTHEKDIAEYAKRIINLRDGYIVNKKIVKKRRSALDDLENWQDEEEKVQVD
ncbi:MAG: ABC transporter ATP-binding protein [candidate division WOR-3 bacterium]|nr:ABC transporter ATP-binding protein [candidate division WOR-3 bacterium]